MENEKPSVIRKRVIAGAIAMGTVLGAAGVASALSSQDTTTPDPAAAQTDTTVDDETTETPEDEASETEREEHDDDDHTPLTAEQNDAVTAAAEAAVPGGTVTKTESEDDGFEAHVTDADGNEVEVIFDADMNVLEIGADD